MSAVASGIGWILVLQLFLLLATFSAGRWLPAATGAKWRRRHAAMHVGVFWLLARAIAFLTGAVLALSLAGALGHVDATGLSCPPFFVFQGSMVSIEA
ncbi:MAG TPA: hypothetical protein PLB41_17040, partial [Rubrivivax sp.]|nr:hypothetical protein [Rubrivivax sp.]